jgi:hypothetical protein
VKNVFLRSVLSLSLGMSTMTLSGGADRAVRADMHERFIGAWRLAELEQEGADGKFHHADCAGMLICTRDGHLSVQVMYQALSTETPALPNQYAEGGYEASYGKYEINDTHAFTFHVEGALVRTLIGKDLKCEYEFSGNQLIVKSADPGEHWRVVWERY